MAKSKWFCALAVLAACTSNDSDPPPPASPLPDCAPDQILVRGADGWVCATDDDLPPPPVCADDEWAAWDGEAWSCRGPEEVTPPDPSPPTVASTSPADGAIEVDRDGSVTVTLSEALAAHTVDAASFTLTDSSGEPVPVDITPYANPIRLTPTVPLRLRETYDVTLTSVVEDLEGEPLPADYTWSFTVRDGRWRTQHLLSAPGSGNVGSTLIAALPGSKAIAAWNDEDSRLLYTSTFAPASGWSLPELRDVEALSVKGIDTAGDRLALVYQTSSGMELVEYDATTGWGSPAVISTAPNAQAVEIDDAGNVVVIHRAWDASVSMVGLEALHRSAAGVWAAPEWIETTDTDVGEAKLAMDASGNAFAVWQQDDGAGSYDLHANQYTAGVGWGTPTLLESESLSVYAFDLGVGPNGDAVVTFLVDDGATNHVMANRFVAGTGWEGATTLRQGAAYVAYAPAVAVDAAGDALVTWTTHAEVYATRATASNGWGTTTPIGSVATWERTGLVIDGDDVATAVAGVNAYRYTPADGWGAAQAVGFRFLDLRAQSVALAPEGDVFVISFVSSAVFTDRFR